MKLFGILALVCACHTCHVLGFQRVSTRLSRHALKSVTDVSNVLIESNFNLAGGTLVLGTICGALGLLL